MSAAASLILSLFHLQAFQASRVAGWRNYWRPSTHCCQCRPTISCQSSCARSGFAGASVFATLGSLQCCIVSQGFRKTPRLPSDAGTGTLTAAVSLLHRFAGALGCRKTQLSGDTRPDCHPSCVQQLLNAVLPRQHMRWQHQQAKPPKQVAAERAAQQGGQTCRPTPCSILFAMQCIY